MSPRPFEASVLLMLGLALGLLIGIYSRLDRLDVRLDHVVAPKAVPR